MNRNQRDKIKYQLIRASDEHISELYNLITAEFIRRRDQTPRPPTHDRVTEGKDCDPTPGD